jgi:hypothetical protein
VAHKKCDLKIATNLSQVYRRNSTNLNCKRHKNIFNKFNIIPKFCFGCYKVQVEPKSIIELIKLFVIQQKAKGFLLWRVITFGIIAHLKAMILIMLF